jgi:signal recognition particle subunit SRP54
MFESLSERLGGVFDRLTKAGALTEADVVTALREVRVALLEADVSPAGRARLHQAVQDKATGAGGDEIDHAGPDGRQDRP